MLKKLNTFKIFLTAATTFLAVELGDSPLRTLSYLSAFLVAGGNFWMQVEKAISETKI